MADDKSDTEIDLYGDDDALETDIVEVCRCHHATVF